MYRGSSPPTQQSTQPGTLLAALENRLQENESRRLADRLSKLEEQINALSSTDDLDTVKARLCAEIALARTEALEERQKINELFSDVAAGLDATPNQLAGATAPVAGTVHTPDPLTGLPARALAEADLRRAHAESSDRYLALFVVKRLALINAKFGYSRGDQVLLKVVAHLRQSLPELSNLFRWTPCAFLSIAPAQTSYKQFARASTHHRTCPPVADA